MNRREFLGCAANGMGAVALAQLMGRTLLGQGLHPQAKAKRVLHLCMNGGASPMDTFDYKPELEKRHGQKFDPGAGIRVEAATSTPGTVLKSPYTWKQQIGRAHV